jgi:hypothetical protein
MNTNRGILVLIVSVGGLLAFGAYEGSTAHERRAERVGQSRELLRLKRKVARLHREPLVDERREVSSSNETQTTCYAHSESEAQEKMLARLEAEEQAQLDRDIAEDPSAELRRYSYHMASALCDEGISERDKVAIAADLSAQLRRSRLEVGRVHEPIQPEGDEERSHQIIKKHLGEERYLSQVMKCAKSNDDRDTRAVGRGIEYLTAIIGLSVDQQAQARSIYEKLYASQHETSVSFLDDAGQLVKVSPSKIGEKESRELSAPEAHDVPFAREWELTRSFFSLLTPEQEQKYRTLVKEHDEGMMFGGMPPFELPERIAAYAPAEVDSSDAETEPSSR